MTSPLDLLQSSLGVVPNASTLPGLGSVSADEVNAQATKMVQAGELLPTQHPGYVSEVERLESTVRTEQIVQDLQEQSVNWPERGDPLAFSARFEAEVSAQGVAIDDPIVGGAIGGYEAGEAVRIKMRHEDAIIANIQRGVDYREQALQWGFTEEDYDALSGIAGYQTALDFADPELLPEGASAEEFDAVESAQFNQQIMSDVEAAKALDDETQGVFDTWLRGEDVSSARPEVKEELQYLQYNFDQMSGDSTVKDMKGALSSARSGKTTPRDAERVFRGVLRGNVPINFLEDMYNNSNREVEEGFIPGSFFDDAASLLQNVRAKLDQDVTTPVEYDAFRFLRGGAIPAELSTEIMGPELEAQLIASTIEGKDPQLVYEEFERTYNERRREQISLANEKVSRYERLQELLSKVKRNP